MEDFLYVIGIPSARQRMMVMRKAYPEVSLVDQGSDQWKCHKCSLDLQNISDDINNDGIIHNVVSLPFENICNIPESFQGGDDDHGISYLDGIMSAGDHYHTVAV